MRVHGLLPVKVNDRLVLLPLQIVAAPEMEAVGALLTFTVAIADALHPYLFVPVTV